jgi:hypothetical protein
MSVVFGLPQSLKKEKQGQLGLWCFNTKQAELCSELLIIPSGLDFDQVNSWRNPWYS